MQAGGAHTGGVPGVGLACGKCCSPARLRALPTLPSVAAAIRSSCPLTADRCAHHPSVASLPPVPSVRTVSPNLATADRAPLAYPPSPLAPRSPAASRPPTRSQHTGTPPSFSSASVPRLVSSLPLSLPTISPSLAYASLPISFCVSAKVCASSSPHPHRRLSSPDFLFRVSLFLHGRPLTSHLYCISAPTRFVTAQRHIH